MLAAEPAILVGLVRLCAGGDLLTQLLITQPELLSRPPIRGARAAEARSHFRAAFSTVFAPGLPATERRDVLRQVKQPRS